MTAVNDVTLTDATNNFGTLSLTAANADVSDANALVLGTSNVTGNLTLTSRSLTQSAAATVGSTLTVNAGAANSNATLDNAGNDFRGAVTFAPGNSFDAISLTNANTTSGALTLPANLVDLSIDYTAADLNVSAATVSNNLTLSSGGNLTQSGALVVTNRSLLTASSDITLTQAANDFGTAMNVTASNAEVVDTNAMVLGTSNVTGNLTLTSSSLTQSAAATVGSTLTVNAGAANSNVTLDNAGNDFRGAVTFAPGSNSFDAISLTNANTTPGALTLPANLVDLSVDYTAADLNVSAATISNNLTLSTGNNLTQSGALNVANVTSITADNATLDNAANDFNDLNLTMSAANGTFNVTDANALDLGDVATNDTASALNLNVGTALTQSGVVTAPGTTSITAANVTLTDTNNDFATLALNMSAANGTFNIADTNSLAMGAVTMNGTASALKLNVGSDLTQSGVVTSPGTTSITAANVTLADTNNDFATLALDMSAQTSGNIADTNSLVLGAVTMNGTASALVLNVGTHLTQSGVVTAPGTLNVTAVNDITLTHARTTSSDRECDGSQRYAERCHRLVLGPRP